MNLPKRGDTVRARVWDPGKSPDGWAAVEGDVTWVGSIQFTLSVPRDREYQIIANAVEWEILPE